MDERVQRKLEEALNTQERGINELRLALEMSRVLKNGEASTRGEKTRLPRTSDCSNAGGDAEKEAPARAGWVLPAPESCRAKGGNAHVGEGAEIVDLSDYWQDQLIKAEEHD